MSYSLRRAGSYAAVIFTTPGDVYTFRLPIAILYLSIIAIYRLPYCAHRGFGWRIFIGYMTFRCIPFAIIVFYWSEISRPIFTLSSTMRSFLHILR